MKPRILMLEDEAERLARFRAVVAKLGAELVSWPDAYATLAELAPLLASAALVSLDHDLEPVDGTDPGDGLIVAKHIVTLSPRCPVIVHTSNGVRGDAMIGELELAGWRYHRVLPVGDDWIERDWYRVARRVLRKRR